MSEKADDFKTLGEQKIMKEEAAKEKIRKEKEKKAKAKAQLEKKKKDLAVKVAK